MIPLVATVQISRKRSHGYIGIPLIPLWILLLPVVIVIAPFALLALRIAGVRPFETVANVWRVFTSLRGTHVEIVDRQQGILIDIP